MGTHRAKGVAKLTRLPTPWLWCDNLGHSVHLGVCQVKCEHISTCDSARDREALLRACDLRWDFRPYADLEVPGV